MRHVAKRSGDSCETTLTEFWRDRDSDAKVDLLLLCCHFPSF